MLIITLNLDSVLLLLHNSKLAYYGFPLYANEVNGRFPFVQCFFETQTDHFTAPSFNVSHTIN